jgi:DNA primase
VRFYGKEIDPISLWADYVEFPPNMDETGPFLPLVRCPNPNHDTLKSHFQINVEEPLVHCFAGCGISGTYENAIRIIEGCNGRQARSRILHHAVSGRGSVRRSKKAARLAVEIVPDLAVFSFLPPVAIEYLDGRRIAADSISRWELGWNPETKRVTIPVRDARGRLKFVIERAIFPRQMPKYLYPPSAPKSEVLFGLDKIDLGMVRSFGIVLTEGSLDAIRLHQHGVTTAVAILGSKESRKQAEIIDRLRPRTIYAMYDRDAAGAGAVLQTRKNHARTPIRVCRYPTTKNDPAELSGEEAHRSLARAISFQDFIYRRTQLTRGE